MKILFIGFPYSVHTVNWINAIDRREHSIHFFPSQPYESIHYNFPSVYFHSDFSFINAESIKTRNVIYKNINPFIGKLFSRNRNFSKIIRLIYKALGIKYSHESFLKKVIKRVNPDVIHILETQNSGYLYSKVEDANKTSKVFLSVWGIDLHYYGILPEHSIQLKNLLPKINFLLVEGLRDLNLAKKLHFKGSSKIIQATGGVDFNLINEVRVNYIKTSNRNAICIKGSQNLVRRALFAIAAIRHLSDFFIGWKIYIYSCDDVVFDECIKLRDTNNLDIDIVNNVSQNELLSIFSKCRLSIIINRSDGISNSLLESAAVGCFPIISNTSCADEIIIHGKNGYIVEYDDTQDIAKHIKKAMCDNEMVDSASFINYDIIKERFDREKLIEQIKDIYK